MDDRLTLVPAGAGAGKTYRIEKTLAQWIEDDLVAPGRVLAVTFTEAAASELRERIRTELISRGRLEDALEIDRAYLGTIHGLGLRLLTEHAFAAGISPENRLISEAERDLLIRSRLSHSDALAAVMKDVNRFGYRFDFVNARSAEDMFRSDVIKTVDLLKGMGDRGMSTAISPEAVARLRAAYDPISSEGTARTERLRKAVEELLAAYPSGIVSNEMNKSAKDAFRKDFLNLRRASADGVLERDWSLWQSLRALRMSKKGTPTPEGYDALAETVIAAADCLVGHPGPLEDACAHLEALIHGAQNIIESYEAAKRDAGLIDYADMIAETERMLREKPSILAAILGEIDCVVIDEFQDTNPVQFSLLWQLAREAPRTLIVGDAKQSIMGFQGADARLSEALENAHSDAVDPLDRNWRSDPRIMEFVNTIGPALFPEAYIALKPTRAEKGETALEAITLPRSWADRKQHGPDCVADRVLSLFEEGVQVVDKASDTLRPAVPSDIAILCYTGADCRKTADALRARGLRVRIQSDGWLSAPVIQAARAGLAFVADPDDTYAAITWLTLGPPRIAIKEALRLALDGTIRTEDEFEALHKLTPAAHSRPVVDILSDLIAETGLKAWAASLTDPAQALADLTRLQHEAREYDASSVDLRQAAGLWGSGIQTFLGWIQVQTDRDFDQHPDATGWSSEGVEVTTWHKSKGREWPITIVSGLDFKFPSRPRTLSTIFDNFEDIDNVLDHAGVRWFPGFAAPEHQETYAEEMAPEDQRSAARALYVALTRARDRLVLALPAEPSSPKARPERMVDLLRARTGLGIVGGNLQVCGVELPARITHEDRDRGFPDPVVPETIPHPLFGSPASVVDVSKTPWRQSPSSLENHRTADLSALVTTKISDGVAVDAEDDTEATDRGTAWHLAYRVMADRPEHRDKLLSAVGLDSATVDAIARQSEGIRNWLRDEGYKEFQFELPIQQRAADGSEINAIIDCLAMSTDTLLILDHKSGACPDPTARFQSYLPQLEAYADLAAVALGKPVKAVAINWMNEGKVSVLPLQ